MTDTNQEVKEVIQAFVESRIVEISREIVAEVLDSLEISADVEDLILLESQLSKLTRAKLSKAYYLGVQEGSFTIAFLMAQ